MRLAVVATAISLCVVGISAASDTEASIRKPINIPAQGLGSALQTLAKDRGFQVVYLTDAVDPLRTQGAIGEFTPEEALKTLLHGTGLTYRYLDEKTVTIFPAIAPSSQDNSGGASTQVPAKATTEQLAAADSGEGKDRRSLWDRFRVAQVDQGTSSQPAPITPTSEGAQNGVKLEEIVVTAQKRDERLQNVPISISVLGGAQLENPTFASVSDALSTVPGVATNQDYGGSGTVVTIRGVASGQTVFVGSSPVAYYLDSMPFGLVKSAIAPDEDAYDLQRIEVLRGPQGTLYGASALNGVVRVLTNDGDLHSFDFKVRGSDSYTDGGSNNYRGDLAVNVPLVDGKLAARAVVGYENDGGWIDTPIKSGANNAELRNYRLKLNAQPTNDLSVGLSWWRTHDNYGAPYTAGANYKNSSLNNQPISTDFDAYALKIGYRNSGYSLSSTSSYLTFRNDTNLDFASLIGFPYVLFTGLTSHVFSQEVLLNSPNDGAWRWYVGGMYRRATEGRLQYDSLLDPVTGFADAVDDTSKSYAAFGELTRLFMDGRLEATVGLRQFEDHVIQAGTLVPTGPPVPAEGKFHATTPRAVLTWHASDNVMIYGSYSQGFRSGFPQDITAPVDYPPVNADKLFNYESGAKGSLWGGRVNFDAAVYYMDWTHVQQTIEVPFQNVETSVVVNGQSASGEGIDLAVTVQPLTGLTLGITASWNNLEMDSAVYSGGVLLFNKGDRLNYSPETTAGASAAYAFPLGALGLSARLSASANYTSAQSFRANPGGPVTLIGIGDPIVIGRLGMSIDARYRWTATLFVNNVNNERGAVIRPYLDPDYISRVTPRTAGLQLEYHFK